MWMLGITSTVKGENGLQRFPFAGYSATNSPSICSLTNGGVLWIQYDGFLIYKDNHGTEFANEGYYTYINYGTGDKIIAHVNNVGIFTVISPCT